MTTSESSITQGVRARALFEGHDIADSADVVVVRDPGHPPVYYFPRKDVFMVFLSETDKVTHNADKGEARYFTIYRDQHIVDNVAWSYEAPPPAFAAIAGRIAFHPAHVDFQVEGHPIADVQEDDDQEISPA
ncbi:MAG: DUF427 domain-containing protein [Caulobacter sp.]|nr:DUF427 domain-containing protein [Caulobacter sp.]